MKIIIHTDGGARGNPGPAAVGVVIEDESGKLITEFGKTIGETTNNVAEYTGVIEALYFVKNNPIIQLSNNPCLAGRQAIIQFYLDSTLVVHQLNGLFKIKDARLRELVVKIRLLENEIGGKILYAAIPREQNRRADFLVNQALDR